MTEKTLVLVVPPQLGLLEGFSGGVISLANYIRMKASAVKVIMLDLSICGNAEAMALLGNACRDAERDLIVGITTTTASYQSALQVARIARRVRKDALIVLGGHHASAQADVILDAHSPQVDVVVRGEGELALLNLIQEFPRLDRVPGISYVDESGRTCSNPPARLLSQDELDSILPTVRKEEIHAAPGKFNHATYVSARGCPLKCAFCSVANEAIRHKSIAAMVRDVRHLVHERGFQRIAMEDNFFTHSRSRTLSVCSALEELRRTIDFTWDCQTRVESIARKDIVDALERAGCEAVYLGVEALTEDHLVYLGKTKHPEHYLRTIEENAVPMVAASQMALYINLQLAIPGDSVLHRQATLSRLRALGRKALECGKSITVFPQLHVVYPGTRHFHDGVQEGRFGPNGDRIFETFTAWEAGNQPILTWLGEFFAHGVGGIPEGLLSAEALRAGKFAVRSDRVLEVVTTLREMEALPGIDVFRYGEYLVRRGGDTPHAQTLLPWGGDVAGAFLN